MVPIQPGFVRGVVMWSCVTLFCIDFRSGISAGPKWCHLIDQRRQTMTCEGGMRCMEEQITAALPEAAIEARTLDLGRRTFCRHTATPHVRSCGATASRQRVVRRRTTYPLSRQELWRCTCHRHCPPCGVHLPQYSGANRGAGVLPEGRPSPPLLCVAVRRLGDNEHFSRPCG
jgi:hypothetical protein